VISVSSGCSIAMIFPGKHLDAHLCLVLNFVHTAAPYACADIQSYQTASCHRSMLQDEATGSRQQALALSAVISHPAVAADPLILCNIARVSKTWREAVQQCSTCSTVVGISARGPLLLLGSLNSMAAWLQVPGHARLVDNLSVELKGQIAASGSGDGSATEQTILLHTAQQLLQLSLQNAAAAPGATATGSAAAAAAAAVAAGALRLSSFSSTYLSSHAVLAALPASTLTKLCISLHPPISGQAMAAALAQLTRLRDMRLTCTDSAAVVPAVVLSGLQHMQRLTSLQLHANFSAADHLEQLLGSRRSHIQLPLQRLTLDDLLYSRQQQQQQQQQQRRRTIQQQVYLPLLQQPSLCIAAAAGIQLQPPRLQMSGLTSLTELHIGSCTAFTIGSSLPLQLRKLALEAGSEANFSNLKLTSLQHLQQLAITVCEGVSVDMLRSLLKLQQLQSLVLTYHCGTAAAVTAAAWQQLPWLDELRIDFMENACSCQEFAGVMAGLGAATSLTKLQLDVWVSDAGSVEVCGHLAGLSRLQDLSISSATPVAAGNAQHLSALVGLTRLSLENLWAGVGDFAAAVLMCSLTQLKALSMRSCELGSCACLAPMAKLTDLTALDFSYNNGVEQRLLVLTSLVNLRVLAVGRAGQAASEVVAEFWAALHAQQQQRRQQ
jgi:hypothetical protein